MQQGRLRLVVLQAQIHPIDDVVDIAEGHAFLRRQLQLPADALLGEEFRPAALPGVGLRGGGQIAVEVETELRLLAPLVQMRQLLAQAVGAVGVEGFQLLILQQQEAVVAIAADAVHFRHPHAFAARQQRQLIGLGGEYRQLFPGVAFHEHLVVTVTHAPRRVNVAPGQFNPFAYLCAAKMFT